MKKKIAVLFCLLTTTMVSANNVSEFYKNLEKTGISDTTFVSGSDTLVIKEQEIFLKMPTGIVNMQKDQKIDPGILRILTLFLTETRGESEAISLLSPFIIDKDFALLYFNEVNKISLEIEKLGTDTIMQKDGCLYLLFGPVWSIHQQHSNRQIIINSPLRTDKTHNIAGITIWEGDMMYECYLFSGCSKRKFGESKKVATVCDYKEIVKLL